MEKPDYTGISKRKLKQPLFRTVTLKHVQEMHLLIYTVDDRLYKISSEGVVSGCSPDLKGLWSRRKHL